MSPRRISPPSDASPLPETWTEMATVRIQVEVEMEAMVERVGPSAEAEEHLSPTVEANGYLALSLDLLRRAVRDGAPAEFDAAAERFFKARLLVHAGVQRIPPTIRADGTSLDLDLHRLLHVRPRKLS